jgi:hypothetical protein
MEQPHAQRCIQEIECIYADVLKDVVHVVLSVRLRAWSGRDWMIA